MRVWLDGLFVKEFDALIEFDEYWKTLTARCAEEKRLIYFLNINEMEFYDQYETIIVQQFSEIENIKINTISAVEAFNLSINELQKYLNKMKESVEIIANPFYGEPSKSDWESFKSFTGGLEWIHHTSMFCSNLVSSASVDKQNSIISTLKLVEKESYQIISQLEKFLESEEFVQLADYVLYEIEGSLSEWRRLIEEEINLATI